MLKSLKAEKPNADGNWKLETGADGGKRTVEMTIGCVGGGRGVDLGGGLPRWRLAAREARVGGEDDGVRGGEGEVISHR